MALTPIRHTGLLMLAVLWVLFAQSAIADELQLVSHSEFPQLSQDLGLSFGTDGLNTSADGRFVCFESVFPLTGDDTNGVRDVYLLDQQSGELRLVSHRLGDPDVAADGPSMGSAVSADGSTVVFSSDAEDLVAGDGNGARDVFIWDRAGGQTTFVSRAEGGGSANAESLRGFVSGDGSKVAFNSLATDFDSGITDTNGASDVFLWDRAGDTITLVSHSVSSPLVAAAGSSSATGFSEAGDAVLFAGTAGDVVSAFLDQNGPANPDLYYWRATSGASELVTLSMGVFGGFPGSGGRLFESVLSADGSSVTFSHDGPDLIAGFVPVGPGANIFQWREATGMTQLVSEDRESALNGGNGPSFQITSSVDGGFVAFTTHASNLSEVDGNGQSDVYRWARSSDSVEIVSRDFMFPFAANHASQYPSMSRDGNTIVFLSKARNLVNGFIPPDPGFFANQLYVWRQGSPIVLASRSLNGPTAGASEDFEPGTVGADGSYAFFAVSNADDLVDGFRSGLFRFEHTTATVDIVSTAYASNQLTITSRGYQTQESAISGDGRYVAFASTVETLVDGFVKGADTLEDVFFFDRVTGTVTLISRSIASPTQGGNRSSRDPFISDDGSLVVFLSDASDLIPGYIPPAGFNPRQIYAWERDTGVITLITRIFGSPLSGVAESHPDPVVSADGSMVIFASEASDLLAPGLDNNGVQDIFFWDRATDTIGAVSRSAANPGQTGNGWSSRYSVSDDGDSIVFRSGSTDLMVGQNDSNGRNDVFLWHRSTDTMTLVNHVVGDPLTPSVRGSEPGFSISGDGQTVAFGSSGSDLAPGADANGWYNIYVWDRGTSTNQWVTQSLLTPGVGGDGDSDSTQLSFDGRALIFESIRGDLVPETVPVFGPGQLYYWDRDLDQVSLISRSVVVADSASHRRADSPMLSADGRPRGVSQRSNGFGDRPGRQLIRRYFPVGSGCRRHTLGEPCGGGCHEGRRWLQRFSGNQPRRLDRSLWLGVEKLARRCRGPDATRVLVACRDRDGSCCGARRTRISGAHR